MVVINMEMPSCCAKCYTKGLSKLVDCTLFNDCHSLIERNHDCPLVEIEDYKVGKWIEERDDYGNIIGWHCSNCYDKTGFYTTCAWDYCPSCGSKNER